MSDRWLFDFTSYIQINIEYVGTMHDIPKTELQGFHVFFQKQAYIS